MESDINRIIIGDTTAIREILFTLSAKIDENFRDQKITEVTPDQLNFFWCHRDYDRGVYDRHYGVPMDLKELRDYLEQDRYEGTVLDRYKIIIESNPAATDLAVTGQPVIGQIFVIRKKWRTNQTLNQSEQKEALEIVSNFFGMGAVKQPEFQSIKVLLESETLQKIRKALRATYRTV